MTPISIIIVFGALTVIFLASIFFINASAGCYPWSPKEVPFHQGMTLCPGQTAVGSFTMQTP